MSESSMLTSVVPADERPLIFISHMTEDKVVAELLQDFMNERSNGEVRFFQSSSARSEGIEVGQDLTRGLMERLWEAKVIILLYTDPARDWAWPVWECGVAMQPDGAQTRPLVLQTTDSPPPMFQHKKRIDLLDEDGVLEFVRQFLTDQNFIPGRNKPLTRFDPHGDEVRNIARELFGKLHDKFPEKTEDAQEWAAYPFLRLSLPLMSAPELRQRATEAKESWVSVVLEECKIEQTDSYVLPMFGRKQKYPPDASLRQLVDDWTATYERHSQAWVTLLCQQVLNATEGRFLDVPLELMRSVAPNDTAWYSPMLNAVRPLHRTGRMEFDIYFNKFQLDEHQRIMMGLSSDVSGEEHPSKVVDISGSGGKSDKQSNQVRVS